MKDPGQYIPTLPTVSDNHRPFQDRGTVKDPRWYAEHGKMAQHHANMIQGLAENKDIPVSDKVKGLLNLGFEIDTPFVDDEGDLRLTYDGDIYWLSEDGVFT